MTSLGHRDIDHAALLLPKEGIPLPEVIEILLASMEPDEKGPDLEGGHQ